MENRIEFNPEHIIVDCRGWRGGDIKCLGKTRSWSGLCNECRLRIEDLKDDLKLVEEFKNIDLI